MELWAKDGDDWDAWTDRPTSPVDQPTSSADQPTSGSNNSKNNAQRTNATKSWHLRAQAQQNLDDYMQAQHQSMIWERDWHLRSVTNWTACNGGQTIRRHLSILYLPLVEQHLL